MLDDDYIIKMVNENSDYYKIAEYIINKFNLNIEIYEGKEIAKYLIKNLRYTKKDILEGKADIRIKNILNLNKLKSNSVASKNEKVQDIPLKTTKIKINRKKVTTALLSVVAMTMVFNFAVKPAYGNMKHQSEIRQSIGMMAASPGTDAYEHKQSIVAQNTYSTGSFDNRGFPIYAYHNDGIAEDIIKVCTQDAELFDLCIYNVYFDMAYNKLSNMDDVIKYLKMYTKNDESLTFIYEKVGNCEVFLDYLVNRGFISPNDKNYYDVLSDIENYKTLMSTRDVPFNGLSAKSQDRIEELISEFKENGENLYNEYKNNINQVGDETYGTRS